MKKSFYFLTAVGPDQPGLVAKVTGMLVSLDCNLEDSSMMRLGSEFGMFVIFTSARILSLRDIAREKAFNNLFIDLKPISSRAASFKRAKNDLWIVRVHGADKSGLVFSIATCLAQHRFNITDLSTHRTSGRVPGYILFVEGEPASPASTKKLGLALKKLSSQLGTHISFSPIASAAL
jgi:glycine cleavage system transcriptional repressor